MMRTSVHSPRHTRVKAYYMQVWRNWQTRTLEGRVVNTVWVQVPLLAPTTIRVALMGRSLPKCWLPAAKSYAVVATLRDGYGCTPPGEVRAEPQTSTKSDTYCRAARGAIQRHRRTFVCKRGSV